MVNENINEDQHLSHNIAVFNIYKFVDINVVLNCILDVLNSLKKILAVKI